MVAGDNPFDATKTLHLDNESRLSKWRVLVASNGLSSATDCGNICAVWPLSFSVAAVLHLASDPNTFMKLTMHGLVVSGVSKG